MSNASFSDDMKVTVSTVQSQVWEKLRSAILSGIFRPGDRLIEAELCKRLGVSRPSVREALRRLEAEKLVTTTPNKGTAVPVITWEEARDIYDLRALLEGEAALRCAELADNETLRQMRAALDDFDGAVTQNDAASRVASTADFYDALLSRCGNKMLKEVHQSLADRINYLRARSMSRPGRGLQSAREMRAMYEAIERRDGQAARSAAVDHVNRARDAAREIFDEVMATD